MLCPNYILTLAVETMLKTRLMLGTWYFRVGCHFCLLVPFAKYEVAMERDISKLVAMRSGSLGER